MERVKRHKNGYILLNTPEEAALDISSIPADRTYEPGGSVILKTQLVDLALFPNEARGPWTLTLCEGGYSLGVVAGSMKRSGKASRPLDTENPTTALTPVYPENVMVTGAKDGSISICTATTGLVRCTYPSLEEEEVAIISLDYFGGHVASLDEENMLRYYRLNGNTLVLLWQYNIGYPPFLLKIVPLPGGLRVLAANNDDRRMEFYKSDGLDTIKCFPVGEDEDVESYFEDLTLDDERTSYLAAVSHVPKEEKEPASMSIYAGFLSVLSVESTYEVYGDFTHSMIAWDATQSAFLVAHKSGLVREFSINGYPTKYYTGLTDELVKFQGYRVGSTQYLYGGQSDGTTVVWKLDV